MLGRATCCLANDPVIMTLTLITSAMLTALAQLETGNNPNVVGAAGELGRYQLMPRMAALEWKAEHPDHPKIPARWWTKPKIEEMLVRRVWSNWVNTFKITYSRSPSDTELYLCWHRPGRVLNPTPKERERAQRFANLCYP